MSFAAIACERICNGVNCTQHCQDGLIPTTCQGAGYCSGLQYETATTEQESRQAENTELMCSEAHPDTEQTAAVES